MTKFKNKYRVESNRWRYWDYSSPGIYFITICILNRKCILGQVIDRKINLSDCGKIVKTEILQMSQYHKRVIMDEWVVMPNHIHLLIKLGGYHDNNRTVDDNNNKSIDNGDGPDDVGPDDVDKIHEFYLPPTPPTPPPQPPSSQLSQPWWHNPNYQPTTDEIKQYRKQRRKMIIPKILGKMKMLTSKQMNITRNTPGQKNWQHDYHDHVVRKPQSYLRIKNYILNNPRNWDEDTFNGKK